MSSAMEKIAASAPKLAPVVAPVVTKAAAAAAPVVMETAAAVAGGAVAVLTSPAVITGVGLYAGYKFCKKLFS